MQQLEKREKQCRELVDRAQALPVLTPDRCTLSGAYPPLIGLPLPIYYYRSYINIF